MWKVEWPVCAGKFGLAAILLVWHSRSRIAWEVVKVPVALPSSIGNSFHTQFPPHVGMQLAITQIALWDDVDKALFQGGDTWYALFRITQLVPHHLLSKARRAKWCHKNRAFRLSGIDYDWHMAVAFWSWGALACGGGGFSVISQSVLIEGEGPKGAAGSIFQRVPTEGLIVDDVPSYSTM